MEGQAVNVDFFFPSKYEKVKDHSRVETQVNSALGQINVFTDTTVTAVEVKALTDETSGYEDGGGFSGSTLVKLIPTYG